MISLVLFAFWLFYGSYLEVRTSRYRKLSYKKFEAIILWVRLFYKKKKNYWRKRNQKQRPLSGTFFLDALSHLYKRSCPSVRRSVGPYVPCYFRRWKVRILGASCAVYPALFTLIILPLLAVVNDRKDVFIRQKKKNIWIMDWIINFKCRDVIKVLKTNKRQVCPSFSLLACTMVQSSQESGRKYWAICSSTRTAHSFTCSTPPASLARFVALIRSLTRSLPS